MSRMSSNLKLCKKFMGEVLKQLEEEEAELSAWMQTEQRRASTESTGKSRPSSEGSTERPNFDGGIGTSCKPTHRGKRKRGQRRDKRGQESSPDLEVPLTIVKEVSKDVDEPSEKWIREEETRGDGMTLPLSISFSFTWIFLF